MFTKFPKPISKRSSFHAHREQTRKAILELLESRDLMAVDTLSFSTDQTLVVRADNTSTNVEVRTDGN